MSIALEATVGAAVLTWRGQAATERCLRSLVTSDGWPFPVLVVDNASGTGEGKLLAQTFGSPIETMTMPKNGGVGYGYNAAIRWARERALSHVLLLNNDTVVDDPSLLNRLLQAFTDDVAAVGPVVIDRDGSVWSAGGSVRWSTGRARRHRFRPPATTTVTWLDGSCVLVSVKAACRVGGFSEDFFLYWEEVDWCVRTGRFGYRCLVEPSTSIKHQRSASATSRQRRFYSLRNALLFMRRNGSWAANLSSTFAYLAVRIPVFIVRRIREGAGLREATGDAVGAVAWNVRDALRSRSWRRPATGAQVCAQVAA